MRTPAKPPFNRCLSARAGFSIFNVERSFSHAALSVLILAVLSATGCIGLTSASKTGMGGSGAALISIAPESITFGAVPLGSTASQSVTISNKGGSELTITQASTKAAGVKIMGISLPLVIGAGKQATVDIVYSPKIAGILSGTISVISNVSKSPDVVSLKGMGMAPTAYLAVSASSLSFGSVSPGKSGAQTVTLTNAGNSNVTVSKVTVQGVSYSASGVSAGLILAPGQSTTLEAWFSPRAAGTAAGSVTVMSNASNSPATITLLGDGAQTGSHSVTLTWIPSTSIVAGYNVYRSETFGGPFSKLDTALVAANEFVDSSVQAGLTYYYVITSVTSVGIESADSVQASATIPTQ